MAFDPYAILGIERDADIGIIKAVFRKLAKKKHPDVGGKPEEFNEISKAYGILVHPESRKRYDETGQTEEPPPPPHPDAAAISLISNEIGAIIRSDKEPDATINLIEAIKHGFQKHIAEVKNAVAKMERDIARAKRLEKKFRRKNQGENKLEAIFAFHITSMENVVRMNAEAVKPFERAIELLTDYDFEVDQIINPFMQGLGNQQLFGQGNTASRIDWRS